MACLRKTEPWQPMRDSGEWKTKKRATLYLIVVSEGAITMALLKE
jgi:hypothetical protein